MSPVWKAKSSFHVHKEAQRKKWVVYCKGLFHGSKKAYDYLSRYTHRVAISNHRLLSLDDQVTFRARDNRKPGQKSLSPLTAQEFIRRFLLHILPTRFVKIRHFGLMAPCNAKTKLERPGPSSPPRTPSPLMTSPDISLTPRARPKPGRKCCWPSPAWISPPARNAAKEG